MSQNITYDDRDAVLNYSPGWFRTGTYNATSVGQTGTLASSSVTGVNVTFVFPTPATEFFYYGIKRCCGGSYLICVDCDPNNRTFITINGVNPTDDGQSPPVVLYSQKFSVPGVHEVILINQEDSAFNGNSQITLDRFDLTVPDPNAVQPSSSANLLSTPTPSSTTVPELVGSSSSSSSKYLAPILGGVLGGLFILLIILGIWLLLRRRSRQAIYNEEQATVSRPQPQSQWRPNSTFTTLTAPTISTTTSRREVDAGRIWSSYTGSTDDPLPPEYGEVFNSAAPPEPSASEQPPRPLKAGR